MDLCHRFAWNYQAYCGKLEKKLKHSLGTYILTKNELEN